MKRAFVTRDFRRWARKAQVDDGALRKAVIEMAQGLVDANLGGGLYKKRIAQPGRGKRGSARTIIASNQNDRWFFLIGYSKNAADNISAPELLALREYGRDLLALDETGLLDMLKRASLEEIPDESPNKR